MNTVFNLEAVPDAMKEAICCHEVFRRLGFRPEEIFFNAQPPSKPCIDQLIPDGEDPADYAEIQVVLRTQGKEFVSVAGILKGSAIQASEVWTELAGNVVDGSIPEIEMARWLASSRVFGASVRLLVAIMQKGIELPTKRPNLPVWPNLPSSDQPLPKKGKFTIN